MDEKLVEVDILKNGVTKTIENFPLQWPENLTILNLSGKNLVTIEDNVPLPHNLRDLNLSHNNFKEVPHAVINLKKLKALDLSYNKIEVFDEQPEFFDSIERVDLSNNALIGPPYWVWSLNPKNLHSLNLSRNPSLTNSFINGYLEELLTYTTSLVEIDLCNCELRNNSIKLLSTLEKARKLILGVLDFNYLSSNHLIELPCEGLDKLCDLESLNVTNTHIYTINDNINIYGNLQEINLTENNIHSLPDEFCLLHNLEICILSHNKLLYLPEEIKNLKKLRILCLDSNELCMISQNLCELENLRILDLYDNFICEVPIGLKDMLVEIDLAWNYFEEPEDESYIHKRQRLRLNKERRNDGRKMEVIHPEDEHTPDVTDDEEFMSFINSSNEIGKQHEPNESSSENWDSDNDDNWIPHYERKRSPPRSPYLLHLKKRLEEGNFCPSDLHTLSVYERVLYEKKCNPQEIYESEGQFDDYSSDDS